MHFPDDVNEYLTKRHHGKYYEEGDRFPVLESHDEKFFGGGKWPCGSMIWIGWNHAYIDDIIEDLRDQRFKDLTVWWETEGEFAGVEKINWTYPRY
jgi:hypothetical protein